MGFLLDARLHAAASFVRKGSAVCDVGTDHGLLAVWLLLNGITDRVTACDINKKPLSAAAQTARKYGTDGRLRLRLSDGLSAVPAEEAEDIIVCGMGGELIAKIISECPYAKEKQRRLILQPMTQVSYLRRFLCGAGFAILTERPAADRGHLYTVLHCAYTGERREIDDLFALVGKMPQAPEKEAAEWLLHESHRLSRIAAGLASGGRPEEAARYDALSRQIAASAEKETFI